VTGQPTGAQLKITRARHHIADLAAQAEQLFHQHWRVVVSEDLETNQRSLIVVADKPIPREFSLLIGDAIHNLRSTLDLAIWSVVSPHNPPKPDRVQFPFCAKADDLPAAIGDRQIDLAGSHVVQIVNEARPYSGGNDELVGLHRCSIGDKHRLIVTVASVTSFKNFDIQKIDPAAPKMPTYNRLGGIGFENQAIWEWFPNDIRDRRVFEGGNKIPAEFEMRFGLHEPFSHAAVIETLRHLTVLVERIVLKLETLE
jgi:hypothetical protein